MECFIRTFFKNEKVNIRFAKSGMLTFFKIVLKLKMRFFEIDFQKFCEEVGMREKF